MGEHILANGIYVRDVFSHTRAGDPFLSHEWLSQVVFALVQRAGGLAFVTIFAGLVIATAYAAATRYMLRRGVPAGPTAVAAIAAIVLGAAHWAARPHLFTLLMLALLLPLIDVAAPPAGERRWGGRGVHQSRGHGERRSGGRGVRQLLLVALMFTLWANLHPGYVIGFALIGAAAAGNLLDGWLDPARRARGVANARALGVGLVVAVGASLVNPYGIGLLLDIRTHLADRYLLSVTNEFQPADFHSTLGLLFLVTITALALGLTFVRRRAQLTTLLPALVLLAAALTARRNIAIFAIAGLPLLTVTLWRAWAPTVARSAHAGQLGDSRLRFAPLLALVLLAVGVNHGSVAGTALLPDAFDAGRFPVEAVARARAAGLEGRLFNEFTWGGYVLYAWPEQTIFIDGMTAFFGAALMREYLAIVSLQPGWDAQLQRRGIDIALLPTFSPLAAELQQRGWGVWHRDTVAIILTAPSR